MLVQPPDSGLYILVDSELVGAVSVYNCVKKVAEIHIEVGPSFNWVVSHIDEGKIICSRYDGCIIPFYTFFFTRLRFRLSFHVYERRGEE